MYIYVYMKIVYPYVLCVYTYILCVYYSYNKNDNATRYNCDIYIYIRFSVYATPTDGGDVNINIILLYTHTRTAKRGNDVQRNDWRLGSADNVQNIGTRTNSKLVTRRHTRSEQDAQKHYCGDDTQSTRRKSIPHVAVNR
jgi:hypothetical protein